MILVSLVFLGDLELQPVQIILDLHVLPVLLAHRGLLVVLLVRVVLGLQFAQRFLYLLVHHQILDLLFFP